ncbi:glutamate dehydrogenase [Gillisia sp. M10.2A]|uniref:Glutamate dehydrogenase n=1 Tax=Gillisia lutea TaxID=2909668 RepID=A0ABS9ECX7_9FLAO|nr:glutamate dehydrogenase [Gillisia lutea]MCF4100731.1 glutamate dehydrogenase [Gillisia lutea]
MVNFRIVLFFFLLCFFTKKSGFAQLGISHEIGVLVGPTSFFTDYGERYNLQNNISNSGIGVGLIHYMNFAFRAECNCYTTDKYFNDHFKIRTEIDYFQSALEHFGPVASKNTLGGKLLRGMHGKSQVFEIGSSLEYYPLSIRDYTAYSYLFSPFISLGFHFVNYQPSAYSDFGPLSDPNNVFPTFVGGIDLDSGSTWGIVGSMGARYRLTPSSDLAIEGRYTYYNTDWLDGLNIDAPQNKANDLIFWLNVGYIYYLDF